MKKAMNIGIAILLSVLAIVGLVACLERDAGDEPIGAQAIGPRPLTPYMSHYYTQTATGDWAILIDLSDRTNYPHIHTNSIVLKGLRVNGAVANDMEWRVEIGVVTIVDTSGITVEHIALLPLVDASTFGGEWPISEHGINLLVSGDSLPRVATNSVTGTALVTSTVMIEGVEGATMPEVGDLILYSREISGTDTMRLSISTLYDTE